MGLNNWVSDQRLIEKIKRSIVADKVSHAYIVEADRCVDKEAFARDFIKAIICRNEKGNGCGLCINCHKVDHGNFEDLHIVRGDESSVKDKDIVKLQEELRKKPIGERNFAILCNGDSMTLRAQNRLLKTLEEPAEGTVIIILSENSENLIQTVKSRCITYRLNGVSEISETTFVAARELIDAFIEGQRFFSLKKLLETRVKNKEGALQILDGMERIYRDIFLGIDERATFIGREEAFKSVEFIEEARKEILMNVNYKYALKNLLIKTGGI